MQKRILNYILVQIWRAGMESWYAVQVRTGREEAVLQLSKKIINESVLKECFIPYYERMKRYQGEWHKELHILFPGYVFLITEQIESLFWELKRIPEFTKILGDGVESIALQEEEKKMLMEIGGQKHLFEMSQGYIVGDMVIITSGPMKKMKGTIIFIDRHKRVAIIQLDMFGRKIEINMGLEIIKKTISPINLYIDETSCN